MNPVVDLVRSKIPEFTLRPMTFEDFLAVCDGERITVEVRDFVLDEHLSREPRPVITLNTGLSHQYRVFVGFHALGHWFGHPGNSEFYLGSRGWLSKIELEASTIGLLALAPHPSPPYPRLVKARGNEEQLELLVDYPRVDAAQRVRWRRRRMVLFRRRQMEFDWRTGE